MRAYLVFAILFSFKVGAQTVSPFTITHKTVTDSSTYQISNIFKSDLFEDSLYIIRRTCSGEWGGTIWFKNKKTNIEKACSATCPLIVNKLNGKYIVTTSLAHLRGSSEILEIANPENLSVFSLPKSRKSKSGVYVRYVGDNESKSSKGSKSLIDTVGVLTLLSFVYQNTLYHIITDDYKVSVAVIENKKFTTVSDLSNQNLWAYMRNMEITQKDDYYSVTFTNDELKGKIEIKGSSITVFTTK